MKKIFTTILILILFYDGKCQSCKIFEISNVGVYLYPITKGISCSKLNDSVSYSIEKKSATKFRVRKLLFDKTIETKDYEYKGKTRSQVFKVRKRDGEEVTIVNEKKLICLLE